MTHTNSRRDIQVMKMVPVNSRTRVKCFADCSYKFAASYPSPPELSIKTACSAVDDACRRWNSNSPVSDEVIERTGRPNVLTIFQPHVKMPKKTKLGKTRLGMVTHLILHTNYSADFSLQISSITWRRSKGTDLAQHSSWFS